MAFNLSMGLAMMLLFLIRTVLCDNFFNIQRIPSSCMGLTINLASDGSSTSNCLTYNWTQINALTTNYTTFVDPYTNQTYYAFIGALTVLGNLDNYSLNYVCPPNGYNGVGLGCQTAPNTQLAILQINALDQKLYTIDIILSGTPFPSAQQLTENQPPFGKARISFNPGLLVQSTGYFQVCKASSSQQCPNQNYTAYKLPTPLPSNYGYGIFGVKSNGYVANSTWIMDDPNQLLIVTAGTQYYYFNATGFFFYDSVKNTCVWSPTCNYKCEAYNYDSRFLDYAGDWVIINKWGTTGMQPKATQIWIGNAIDAAGIFPVVMYTDKISGHYLGLDKLDAIPAPKMGATYWYPEHGPTVARVSIQGFSPSVVEARCVSKLSIWTGGWPSFGNRLQLSDVRIICFMIFLSMVQIWM